MSKKTVLVAMALVVMAAVAIAAENAWFNPQKCAMCTAIVQVPGLMESMNEEQLPISNGIVTVTTVDDQHLKGYRQAHGEMQGVIARVQKGENVPLCGSCTALFQLMPKGVKQDYVETQHGDVWILTSNDPAVVAQLQAWAKRNTDEMAKMKSTSAKPAGM
jgi:hypothetical protein